MEQKRGDKPKRIAFVVPVLAPYARLRFEALAKDPGLSIHVIAQNKTVADRTGWSFGSIPGCKTYLLKSIEHKFVNDHSSSGYVIRNGHFFSFGLRKLLREISPDIVIVCNASQLAMLSGPKNYKVGIIVEDTLRAAEGRKWVNRTVKRFFLKQADAYFAFSDDANAFLLANGIKNNIFRTSWSIDNSIFRSIPNKAQAREALGLNRRTYLIVASLIPRKGIGQFLDAWEGMGDEFRKQNELLIIGDGPLEAELKKHAEGNPLIRFLGHLPYAEVARYMQCADVFVLPTLEDLCSLSVFEALAAGLPVLTTIYNGARFLIDEGVTGFVFDSENKSSIMDALNKIDNSDIEKMSQNALTLMDSYSNSVVMADFAAKIKQLLA